MCWNRVGAAAGQLPASSHGGSELDGDAGVDLTSGEVIRHSILGVGDVGDPIVRIDVADAEEVEGIETYPQALHHAASATAATAPAR